jgi:hypothetical protein
MFQRVDHDHSFEIAPSGGSVRRRIAGRSRRPQGTDFLEIIRENYAPYVAAQERKDRPVPWFVKKTFEGALECGDIDLGFATMVCVGCELEIEQPFSCLQRGICPSCLQRRMRDRGQFIVENVIGDTPMRHWVPTFPRPLRSYLAFDPALTSELLSAFLAIVFALVRRTARRELGKRFGKVDPGSMSTIQRNSSFLDLNVHFHCLVTDGVFYRDPDTGRVVFHRVAPPTTAEIAEVARELCRRTCQLLLRRGMWQDLADPKGSAAADSKFGLISLGKRKRSRRRVVRFIGRASDEEVDDPEEVDGAQPFDVFAGEATAPGDRSGLRSLVEYALAPPFTCEQVTRVEGGLVQFRPKRPRRDGTTHRTFEPLDFLHTIATLIPRPRLHTTRFHGVFARRHSFRSEVVPAAAEEDADAPHSEESESNGAFGDLQIALAELSKRTFPDDRRCPECQGQMILKEMVTENMVFRNGRRTPRAGPDPP